MSPRPAPPSQSWKPSPPWKKETWKARYPQAHSTTRDPRSPLERLSRPQPPHTCTLESLLLSQTRKNAPGAPKTSCPGRGGPPPWPGDHLLGGWPPAVMAPPPTPATHTHTHTHIYWRDHRQETEAPRAPGCGTLGRVLGPSPALRNFRLQRNWDSLPWEPPSLHHLPTTPVLNGFSHVVLYPLNHLSTSLPGTIIQVLASRPCCHQGGRKPGSNSGEAGRCDEVWESVPLQF